MREQTTIRDSSSAVCLENRPVRLRGAKLSITGRKPGVRRVPQYGIFVEHLLIQARTVGPGEDVVVVIELVWVFAPTWLGLQ